MYDPESKLGSALLKTVRDNTLIKTFDSAQEFADDCARKVSQKYYATCSKDAWNGNETFLEAVENVSKGWPHVVGKAEKLLEQIESEGLLSAGYSGWKPEVAGAFPLVPAAIIGAPESMFDKAENQSELNALRVVVDNAMWAGIPAEQMQARGTAIAALVLGLAARRPVELYCFASLDGYPNNHAVQGMAAPLVRIDTRPMDIAALSYCLASAAFYRRLQMSWAEQYGYQGLWAYGLTPNNPKYEAAHRVALGLEAQDVFIPGLVSRAEITDNPVQWVRDNLAAHIIENQNAA